MIDLHTHTTHSDGTDTVEELLKKANANKIKILSITDHNTCKAYVEINEKKFKNIYTGKLIIGCEFTTYFNNKYIEILGYNFNYQKVQKYLDHYYSKKNIETSANILRKRLINKIRELNLTYNEKEVRERKSPNEFFERPIYEELIKYEENKCKLKEDIWESFSHFFRKGLTNNNSKLFINPMEFKLSLKQVIDLIHDSGGLAFLAHPYQYKFENVELFLEQLYKDNNLDGIECIYTTFTKENIDYLTNFAKRNNLLISGGSDYHGENKIEHNLGKGKGNLNINEDILKNWNIKYKEI